MLKWKASRVANTRKLNMLTVADLDLLLLVEWYHTLVQGCVHITVVALRKKLGSSKLFDG